jgi:hypothetical protein
MALLSLLAACGSSRDGPVLNGGINGGIAPGGTVEGFAIAPVDGGALSVAAFCSSISTNVTALVAAFSSYPSFCAFKRMANTCGDHPGTTEAVLIVVRAGASAPPAIGVGTYPLGTSSSGGFTTAASVDFRRLEAGCAEATTFQSVTGSITIDELSPSLKGSVSATFWSGAGGTGTSLGTFSGSFDVGTCTLALDICGLITGSSCPTPACIP